MIARWSLRAIVGLAFVCIIGAPRAARANGRFPQAQVIESVPGGDGSTLFLRATFGVLVSRDAGASWRWICERALGYEGQWDPPIAVTRDGRLWVGLERGLVSTLDGCDVEESTELGGQTVKDLTTDARGGTLWAITGAPGTKSWIWRRSAPDAGAPRFERLDGLDDTNFMTIEVAPSNPSRLYVSGQPYATIRGRLYRSDDGGKTLEGHANDLAAVGPFFIGAVDPKDPSRVFVRHLHTKGSDLLLTTDAGKSFKNVLSVSSAMLGFAKSADGATYWAGSGLADHGLLRSTDRGEHFEPVAKHGVLCLHAAPGGRLFVCENPFKLGAPAIGISLDGGKTTRSIPFSEISGPVTCAKGRTDAGAAICGAAWAAARASVSPLEDAGGAAPDGGLDGGGPPDAGTASGTRSSCGCTLVGRTTAPDLLFLIAGPLALALRAQARGARGSTSDRPGPCKGDEGRPRTRSRRIFPR